VDHDVDVAVVGGGLGGLTLAIGLLGGADGERLFLRRSRWRVDQTASSSPMSSMGLA
jgi:cation diffusion facilitator CzcD-associated flavoprotein CzcO